MPRPTQDEFNSRLGATGSGVREYDSKECQALYEAAETIRKALARRDLGYQRRMGTLNLAEFANLSAGDGDPTYTREGRQR